MAGDNIYIYPYSSSVPIEKQNPYIQNFMDGMAQYTHVLNHNRPNNNGILDIATKINQIDVLILNWIENLPEKKGGVLQGFLFVVLVYFLFLKKSKIIWIMHNKKPHSDTKKFWKKLLFKFTTKKSTHIITHSYEGVDYLRSLNAGYTEKVKFIHHPVHPKNNISTHQLLSEYNFDIIIWGTVSPYKGIHQFLENLLEKGISNDYRILIAGKFNSTEYFERIKNLSGNKTKIMNRFIQEDELVQLIQQSKIILFPYKPESVLSSGALMDSIQYPSVVIGPHVGAFADLADLGIIKTFSNYSDLIVKINESLKTTDHSNIHEKRKKFIEENSWDKFASILSNVIIRN